MSNVIGTILSHAVAVAIDPLPVVAVILMLSKPKATTNSVAFLGGWLLGLLVVSGAVLLLGGLGSVKTGGSGESPISGIIKLFFGLLLLLLALWRWRTRLVKEEEPEIPSWMAAIDRFGPAKAVGMAALLSSINPKNLALTLTTASAIAAAGISAGRQMVGLAVFVVLGSITVTAPIIFYHLMRHRAEYDLNRIKNWLIAHNNTIITVLLVVFGAKLFGEGIGMFID
jgi:threonine/homoserine/homoserine lactone efflux protein